MGAFTGALFGGIHDGVTVGMGKVLAHGLAGGVSSVLNGGKFGHGFMSAGITQFAGYKGWMPKIGANNLGQRIKNAVSAAVLGGTVSRLTGGKFASGAITGAFSRLLNDMAEFRYGGSSKYHEDANDPKVTKYKPLDLSDCGGGNECVLGNKGVEIELNKLNKQLQIDNFGFVSVSGGDSFFDGDTEQAISWTTGDVIDGRNKNSYHQ